MTTIPLMQPVLPDQPDVWRALTDEQLRLATETDEHGLLTARAMQVRESALLDRWYLIRNVYGWASRETNRIETHFTVAGIERPYHGVWGVYAAMQQITQSDEMAHDIAIDAHEMGMLEPISIQQAQALYDRIRAKVGPHADIGPRPAERAGRR